MKKYRVLWIDDEWEKQSDFITEAEQEDIIIEAHKTARDGMCALENSIDLWDAIILDAKVYDKSVDETPDLDGLYNAISKIEELKSKRNIPWFVLTGQPDRMGNLDFEKSLRGRKPYSKNIAEDKEKLFEDIKKEADNSLETQIRHQYSDIFATDVDKSIMLKLLMALETKDTKNSAHLTDIRKIMEDFFKECKAKSIIPLNRTSMNDQARHLYASSSVPKYIGTTIIYVTTITQSGSHRSKTDKVISNGSAPYLIDSTIKALLNIILWWDGYKKANPQNNI